MKAIQGTKEKHPLMYKGWLIRYGCEQNKNKLCAYNFQNNTFINPLYDTWEQLKSVIDQTKF